MDSVRRIMDELPQSSRISYLREEMQNNIPNSKRLDYARLLYQEAKRQQDEEAEADAIYMFNRHFYQANPDSLRYWLKEAEPLFVRVGRLEDICRMKAWNIYLLSRGKKFDEALSAIQELKDFSEKIHFSEGLEMADQSLADLYIGNEMYKDGENLYLDVMERMKKRNAPPVKRLNILRQLYTRLRTTEDRLVYSKQAEQLVEECKAQGMTELDNENPMYAIEYSIWRALSYGYSDLKNFEESWKYLQKIDSIASAHQMVRAINEIRDTYFHYYYLTQDYAKALPYLEEILAYTYSRDNLVLYNKRLEQKTRILYHLGKYKDAYLLSTQLQQLKDSINQKDFHQTLANVRTEYEVERLEVEKQHMKEQAKQTRMQLMWLLGGCFLLVVVVIVLSNMIRIIQRNRKELKIAKEKAEEADQLKSAFLANMNHEIRTPLNAIVGFSQVLVEEEEKDTRREFAEIIQNNNELLQRLIADVLDISKIDSNSMSLIYSEQDMETLMKEVYNVISLRMQSGVELILDPCVPCKLETDRNRLMQVLTNLLTNAIKHTEKGHIRFGYELLEEDIRFYVEDTGEGIGEEQLESIFDRFVQLANGKKGVGLGLAICKGLVTKMGGKIWVTSKLGAGSTFHVQVPKVRIGACKQR